MHAHTQCTRNARAQVTREQYKEMLERRRAELPPPPARPGAASEGEEGPATPRKSPKERMDENWGA